MKEIMRNGFFLAIIIIISTAPSVFSYALDETNTTCGIGSMLWSPPRTGMAKITARSTNKTLTQDLSLVSGTSGCEADSKKKYGKIWEVKKFLLVNADHLAEEISVGKGEYLVAYAYLLGCSANSQADFARITQSNYEEIYSQPDNPDHILSATREVISSAPELSGSCKYI